MSSSQTPRCSDQETLIPRRRRARKMIEEKLFAFYSRGVPAVNLWMAVCFFGKMEHHQVSFITSPSTIMYLGCLVLSFLTGIGINMTKATNREPTGRWMMAYVSTMLQISAASALMLFFGTTGTVIVVPLFVLVLVLVSYSFSLMIDPAKEEPGFSWPELKEPLSRGFEMSALVVSLSVAGLSGKVLGYMEVEVDLGFASNLNVTGGHGLTAVAPEFFLFCSAVSGLLVVLFCTVPPSLINLRHMEKIAKVYIPRAAYMALLFHVVATVVAAEKFLQWYVYLVCCSIAILALFLYLSDAQQVSPDMPLLPRTSGQAERSQDDDRAEAERRRSLDQDDDRPPEARSLDDDRQDQAKESKNISTAGISSILLAVMAIHSSYGGIGRTVSLRWLWKAFVFSGVCSILSHTVHISISYQMTERKRYEISRQFWTMSTYLTITVTGVLAGLVIYQHPGEVKNIF